MHQARERLFKPPHPAPQLRGMDIQGEVALSKLFSLPSEKASTQKGKNLLPLGANSFLLE